eukprot:Colp12_sorted_trinity150504_noHs@14802
MEHFRAFYKPREKTKFTDVTLRAFDNSFHLHRVILSSQSERFLELFTQIDDVVVELPIHDDNITFDSLSRTLEYMYGFDVCEEEAEAMSFPALVSLLSTASYLRMNSFKKFCGNLISSPVWRVTEHNLIRLLRLSETYDVPIIAVNVTEYLKGSLQHIYKTNPTLF